MTNESELLRVARLIEDLKQPCGEDPESPQAIRNSRYMSIAAIVRGLAERKPLPGALVIEALYAMDTEAKKRGSMFPQTQDEQDKDSDAVHRVVGSLRFYTEGRQVSESGWPSIKDWPALP